MIRHLVLKVTTRIIGAKLKKVCVIGIRGGWLRKRCEKHDLQQEIVSITGYRVFGTHTYTHTFPYSLVGKTGIHKKI